MRFVFLYNCCQKTFIVLRKIQRYTELDKIMLILMDYFSSADRRTPWVTV